MRAKRQAILPETYLITGDNPKNPPSFLNMLASCLEKGITLVQFRARQLSHIEYMKLADKVVRLCHQYGASVILNNDAKFVGELNADGVHLNSARLSSCQSRPLDKTKLVSASCHNAQEIRHAEKIGVDFVTLSPVFTTTSHVCTDVLGWENFAKLSSIAHIPVFALGGVSISDIELVKKNGGYGIAAIRALWGAASY